MALGLGTAMLLGSGLNFLGNSWSNITNRNIASESNAYNLRLWNLQNVYNSPTMQMARYKVAGLNPNLIYGSGSASAGNAQSPPQAVTPHVESPMKGIDPSIYMQALSTYQNIKTSAAQEDLAKRNAELTAQKTVNEAVTTNILNSTARLKDFQFTRESTLLPYQRDTYEQNVARLKNLNNDLLFKIKNLNPANLRKIQIGSDYIEKQKNELLPSIIGKNKSSTAINEQQLGFLNPQLMQLRQYETQLKNLDLQLKSGMSPYGMTPQDNIVYRFLGKLLPPWNLGSSVKSTRHGGGGEW